MKFLLNERSLHGQFKSNEEFFCCLGPVVKCIELIHSYSSAPILKNKNFYECKVTENDKICDLKNYMVRDDLMRFQISLDKEIYTDPYWDTEPFHDIYGNFMWNGEDISATSIAEAAVTNGTLLSFDSEKFKDCKLNIETKACGYNVDSVHTPKYLVDNYRTEMNISRKEYLLIRYNGTRIDCQLLEEEYGPSILQKHEFNLLLSTFDKFINHDSWESIALDDGLEYKKYSPSSHRVDWFNSAKYRGKTIMKFRFSDTLRCFGYRKGDKFKVLRLERDHTISDNG